MIALALVAIPAYAWGWPAYTQWRATLLTPDSLLGLPRTADSRSYVPGLDARMHALGAATDRKQSIYLVYRSAADPRLTISVVGWAGWLSRPGTSLYRVLRSLPTQGVPLHDLEAVDPGPLSGTAACAAAEVDSVPYAICGWADHGSLVVLFLAERTPGDGAALLRSARPSLLHR